MHFSIILGRRRTTRKRRSRKNRRRNKGGHIRVGELSETNVSQTGSNLKSFIDYTLGITLDSDFEKT